MNTQNRQSGSDRFVSRFYWLGALGAWIGSLSKRPCPSCSAGLPLSKLGTKGAGRSDVAVCPDCGTKWHLADGFFKLMLKMVFFGFPLMFLSVGLTGAGLEKIPFFYNENAVGPNDHLRFQAFPILAIPFYLSWAFFLRLLPLKKVNS